jgi:hypothetical protein
MTVWAPRRAVMNWVRVYLRAQASSDNQQSTRTVSTLDTRHRTRLPESHSIPQAHRSIWLVLVAAAGEAFLVGCFGEAISLNFQLGVPDTITRDLPGNTV